MRCLPAHHFTVAKARAWRSAIDDDPSYQRAGDVWTLAQRQRFIDSLMNGYDVPKIYLHDQRGIDPTKVYAIVDGKQRLHAIWSFLADGFQLAPGFRIESVPPEVGPDTVIPAGALLFSGMDPRWQALLLRTYLSVVLIRDATEDDIDELFARLNDGAPLTRAEARNAIAGDMSGLVREVAARPEFAAALGFADVRGSYRVVAAAALALEVARRSGDASVPGLAPDELDAFVRRWRVVEAVDRDALVGGVLHHLATAASSDGPPVATVTEACEWLRAVWAGGRKS